MPNECGPPRLYEIGSVSGSESEAQEPARRIKGRCRMADIRESESGVP